MVRKVLNRRNIQKWFLGALAALLCSGCIRPVNDATLQMVDAVSFHSKLRKALHSYPYFFRYEGIDCFKSEGLTPAGPNRLTYWSIGLMEKGVSGPSEVPCCDLRLVGVAGSNGNETYFVTLTHDQSAGWAPLQEALNKRGIYEER